MRGKRGWLGLGVALGATASIAAAVRGAMLHEPHLLWTMSGPALVYTTRRGLGEPARVLRTGGVYQSATYLGERRMEPVFEYYRAFGRLFELRPDARHVLAIGGGGFAFPKLVAARHPGVRMDVVEIDPAVVRAAHRWFFLDDAIALARANGGDLRVICDDGRSFLEDAPGPYDAVVLDAFVGEKPVRSLAPGGLLLMNVVSCDGGADVSFLRSTVATALAAFPNVRVLLATDATHAEEDNYLLVASDGPLDLSDAISYDEDFLGEVFLDEA